ncbi:MAG: hypothetical protein A2Y75_06130 [Candidatus Solincola sediminis]|uniref:Peptidase S8/S53 domain-containing protein n=1 Tax=Candidatus Solincola sediminis TaxID=1797199 RepID=A0A1F2WKF4_9ACTN|nr:MAG: hypothetical protein A2Y75_06130 [Candidatus Solincola sediminis]
MAVTKRLQGFRLIIVAAITILLLAFAPFFVMGQAAQAASAEEVWDKVLIRWNQGSQTMQSFYAQASENPYIKKIADAVQSGEWATPELESVTLPSGTLAKDAKRILSSIPGVAYVEPDTAITADLSSGDPFYSRQWFLPDIGAERAWDSELGDPGLVVAVLDTGVDASHPDLSGRVLQGWDFITQSNNTSDVYGHGTHVAGIIAASGNNGAGVAGVAWNVQLLPVKVLDNNGNGRYSDLISGIRYAADSGASVINMSLGGASRSQALQEAVDYARGKGAVVVAAAGNNASSTLSYPAACDGAIAVGATDDLDRRASFSNWGSGLDIMSPGVSIYSDYPGARYTSMSGTSMATPQVAGAFALLRSYKPGLSVAEAERRILESARDLGTAGYDLTYGWGLLQVDKALGLQAYTPVPDGLSGAWYFAEGYTGGGFDTYLLLENPANEASAAHLELFGDQGPSAGLNIDIAAQSRITFHLNELVPPGDVAAKISLPEGSQVVAQRSMYFDYRGITGGHTAKGSQASTSWYFAEGYTGPGFDTYLLVFNPQNDTAAVDIAFMTPDGNRNASLDVPPLARKTLRVNDVLPGSEMGIKTSSDRPVVAERAMYFNSNGRSGGSAAAGASSPSREWYFAEGYTGGDFDEWLLMVNPGNQDVTANVSFQRSDGVIHESDLAVAANSRATLHVDDVAGLEDAQVSAEINTSAPGLIVERAMYFTYDGGMGKVDGGHAAGGSASPSPHWLIPEGYTADGFESWILVANLEDRAVTVKVNFYGERDAVEREYTIEAHSRFTIKENDILPGQGVSVQVNALDDSRLVVEGAFYFRYNGSIDDGST